MNEFPENIYIRKADEGDVREISELEKVCFPEEPWSYEMVYDDIVLNDRTTYLVAVNKESEEEEIAGYMGVWQILDEGHITNVAVAPKYRRQHIAENIIDEIINLTKENGIKSWTLEVRTDNDPAIALYEKMGFEIAGVRKKYYEYDNSDAYIMWKTESEENER